MYLWKAFQPCYEHDTAKAVPKYSQVFYRLPLLKHCRISWSAFNAHSSTPLQYATIGDTFNIMVSSSNSLALFSFGSCPSSYGGSFFSILTKLSKSFSVPCSPWIKYIQAVGTSSFSPAKWTKLFLSECSAGTVLLKFKFMTSRSRKRLAAQYPLGSGVVIFPRKWLLIGRGNKRR